MPGPEKSALKVGLVLLPRFTLTPFAAFTDVLRLAADERDRSRQINCRWTVMADSLRPVKSSCGVEVTPFETFRDPKEFDYIAFFGGLRDHEKPEEKPVIDYMTRASEAGVPIIGLCTAVFSMIRAGLMEGRRCCVNWLHYQEMLEEFDNVIPDASQLFVVDGNRITCAGGAGAADLAAWLIERHLGRALAHKSLRIMLLDDARPGSASQPQPPLAGRVANPRVARAMLLIEQNMSDPLEIDEIAARVHISRRQLERDFREETGISIAAFSRRLRLCYGLWLVLRSRRSIIDISLECGFNGQSHFATLFRKEFDISPTEARRLSAEEAGELIRVHLKTDISTPGLDPAMVLSGVAEARPYLV